MSRDDRAKESFYFVQLPNGWTVGHFRPLEALDGFVHAVTTRQGLVVPATSRGAASAATQMSDAMGLSAGVAYCKQIHGKAVVRVRRAGQAGQGDGLVTATASLGVMGFSADCPLILAADPVNGAVGVAHASWKGTAKRIASELILQMAGAFGANPADVIACIGPAVGPCCYEVGADVFHAVTEGVGVRAEQFFEKRGGKLHLDLWAANMEELLRAGLLPENIHAAGICTVCRNDLFPSYPAEGEKAQRFVAVIART
jgi:YfiH family protein